MIPIKIQIKNFLSYGDELQTIDFSNYHLVCLSGKNGHGKSALLDAITWAIWGQARKVGGTAKADQGLLRLGQTHMLVILDFECNGTHYRVRREFALTYGKPYAALDFGIVDQTQENIIPLTEKTIRGTQHKIESTIHLDYDSFINSAFLRQGYSNEFSKKSPKDRKEILANILGLQHYELLRKLANDTVREKSTVKQQLTTLQEKIQNELAKTDQINSAITQITTQLKEHHTQEQNLLTEQKRLQKEQHQLLTLKHEEQHCTKELNELQETYRDNSNALRTTLHKWRSTHRQQMHMHSLELLKKQKYDLNITIAMIQKQHQEKLHKQELYLKTQQSFVTLEQKIKHEQLQLTAQRQLQFQQIQLQHKQIEQKLINCKQQQQLLFKEVQDQQALITASEQNIKIIGTIEIKSYEQLFEKRRTYYQQWIAQANVIKNEFDQAEQKRLLVNDDDSPSCPLCEQNLSATRKKFLKQKLLKHEEALTHRYTRLKNLIVKIKTLLIEQHEQLTIYKKKAEQLALEQHKMQLAQQRIAQLNEQQKSHNQLQASLEKELTQHAALLIEHEKNSKTEAERSQKELNEHPEYTALHKELLELKHAYETAPYDQKVYLSLQEQLQAIEKQLLAYETIQEEIKLQDERKKEISRLCADTKVAKFKLLQTQQKLRELAVITELEKQYKMQEALLEEKRTSWAKRKDELLQENGKLEQQQDDLKKLSLEHAQQQTYIATLTQEIDDYQEITSALSKNGIQALLIEDAIPEIEQEANDLLSRLTDNQATILIESLRDLKSGGSKETLDIKISDAAGIRPYELFSGGEAFRIDFSLRIAISKLLARRAGTSLQTLIIDEGFGSQDEEGLSYIMDAIYRIQDSFKKVIIVSHLPRLKDQFPVHFYVEKTPQGSHVQIFEQA